MPAGLDVFTPKSCDEITRDKVARVFRNQSKKEESVLSKGVLHEIFDLSSSSMARGGHIGFNLEGIVWKGTGGISESFTF